MRKLLSLLFIITLWLISSFPSSSAAQKLIYDLEIDEENWDSFHIRIVAENVNQDDIILVLPKWRPGIYVELDSYQFIGDLHAYSESTEELSVTQLDENRWLIQSGNSSTVRIEYDVDHSSPRFMMSYLSKRYAIVDGALNFLYIMGKRHLPIDVNLRVPHGWKVASALSSGEASFEFFASNYDELIDSPMLISNFKEYYFTLENFPFFVIMNGTANFDINNFLVMIKRIVDYQGTFFADYPFDRYLFLVHVMPQGSSGGGLEFSKSSLIILSKELLTNNLKKAANIIAHEFFHAWNVKRIYPDVFASYDYTTPERTKDLWFIEGVTSYYADLTLIRTGIWSERDYLDSQANMIKKVEENPERMITSLEEASISIWEKGYLHNGTSFYDKGQVITSLLDLSIRDKTDNSRSMDDVLRFMNQWFANHEQGYEEDDILRAVNAISGYDHTVFFNKYISGTLDLPYGDYLNCAGITIQTVPIFDVVELNTLDSKIVKIDSASIPYREGLRIGDELKFVGGLEIKDQQSFLQALADLEKDKPTEVKFSRLGKEKTITTVLKTNDDVQVELGYIQDPDDKQLRIRNSLLGANPF
ncbi:M61 family metallopeptidase [candidate division KSB1 bacterium]|nr:M61 family metallopeptidase [candidate division KSB1 bacterium]